MNALRLCWMAAVLYSRPLLPVIKDDDGNRPEGTEKRTITTRNVFNSIVLAEPVTCWIAAFIPMIVKTSVQYISGVAFRYCEGHK
ncbi:hypothetical protein [Chitinophaga ginsengisoli]|uniref:hypothetical protein n=1 Tax=Chitinophaga ginsengisoli TaxID=363837 RepID=UPI0011B21A4E|nr:hypothetical protein [Chitinophaga ginsengisoli]